jgi:uncharacterized protein YuzE
VTDDMVLLLADPLPLGGTAIDRYHYYEAGDVLYLTAGAARMADETAQSLEGDTVFLDAHGGIIGVTIVGAREVLDRDGTLNVTLPRLGLAARWPRARIEPLLFETSRY